VREHHAAFPQLQILQTMMPSDSRQKLRIGVDGGGTKTECILVDATGAVVGRQSTGGCNPNVAGAEAARATLTDALRALVAQAPAGSEVVATHLFMAGAPPFWRDFAAQLQGFGRVIPGIDSLPVLELATGGQPGLVIHAGTGSFVAARGSDGSIHYAGGLGWRFGDPGSGYDLGRRTVARGLLELQGWAPATRIATLVRTHAGFPADIETFAVTRYYYAHAEPNRVIAALAPEVLRLATEGEAAATEIARASAGELLDLAKGVARKLFPGADLRTLPVGLSGPILNHPVIRPHLAASAPFTLTTVEGTPIEGVRRLVSRSA
jgi:N-acetylglucosamine kinase-like BadF-type ATPase